MADPRDGDRLLRPLATAAAVACMAGAVALVASSADRFIDQDELLHLNTASFTAQGERAYRDFFEYHPPLFSAFLQPIVRSSADPVVIFDRARGAMLVWTAAILAIVARLGHRIAGRTGAIVAPALLCGLGLFIDKTIEVRPDVPASACVLLGIWFASRGLDEDRPALCVASGALFALAGLLTPKVVYPVAGAVAAAIASAPPRSRLRVLLGTGAGGVAVVAAVAGVMALFGMLVPFLTEALPGNVGLYVSNLDYYRKLYLVQLVRANTATVLLAIGGAVWLFRSRGRLPRGLGAMLSVALGTAVAGIFHIGAPMRQYYLSFAPLIALAATAALVALARAHAPRAPAAAWAAAFAVVAVCVGPAFARAWEHHQPRYQQERFLREVVAVTQPGDRVFDCWSGLYLTRLPAYEHFFLLSDVFRILDPQKLESDLLEALANPEVRVVIVDTNFPLLPDSVQDYVRRTFVPRPGFDGLLVRR